MPEFLGISVSEIPIKCSWMLSTTIPDPFVLLYLFPGNSGYHVDSPSRLKYRTLAVKGKRAFDANTFCHNFPTAEDQHWAHSYKTELNRFKMKWTVIKNELSWTEFSSIHLNSIHFSSIQFSSIHHYFCILYCLIKFDC